MTEQTTLSLISATVGFVSALCFFIGSIPNTTNKIIEQSTPYFVTNHHLTEALIYQRAQYVVGALLLLVSFSLQIAATLASSTNQLPIPQVIQPWHAIVLAVLISTSGISYLDYSYFAKREISRTIKEK